MEPISPELALVDPELARRARALLPDPQREPSRQPPSVAAPSRARRPRLPRDLLLRTAAWLAVPSIALNIAYIRADSRIDSKPTFAPPEPTAARSTPRPAPPAASPRKRPRAKPNLKPKPEPPKPAPRAKSSRSLAGSKLRWTARGKSEAFDVILWRGHRRVADVWTTKRELALDDLACRTNMALASGRYLWFVYPVLDTKTRRYGPLLKWGKVDVPAGTRCRGRSGTATAAS